MNIEKQYLKLLKDILENGITKQDRTGTGTISVFGRQIRHDMKLGFPLLTTKKMYWKGIITELLWFLRGDTDIRFLWKNNCSIWDGDWYKKYKTTCSEPYTLEEVKQKIKDGNHNFHDSMFDLGPIYGKQWRDWDEGMQDDTNIDQISNLINDLKTNPDSRRLMISAWNVGELDQMTLPPCHYGFQIYTRELTHDEKIKYTMKKYGYIPGDGKVNIPERAISLMWNQRSIDVGLGLPFNIASYALLLEILAKEVNMIPYELIGNLGDCHIYNNHIDDIKDQLTRELYPLPTLKIKDEVKWAEGDCLPTYSIDDFTLENYQSHSSIKLPLSN